MPGFAFSTYLEESIICSVSIARTDKHAEASDFAQVPMIYKSFMLIVFCTPVSSYIINRHAGERYTCWQTLFRELTQMLWPP